MIPWIQVYSNLPQHPKTTKLADELALASASLNPNVLAAGMVVSLWAWAIQNAYNGDLSGCSPRAIAEACQWKKKPETLVKALQKAGFLDADMRLHNWDDYTVIHQDLQELQESQEDSKIKHRERQRRYRERKKQSVTGDITRDGTVTSRCDTGDTVCDVTGDNTVTLPLSPPGSSPFSPPLSPPLSLPQTPSLSPPYIPPQNPQLNPPHTHFSGGGGDAQAQAREEINQFCQERDLEPDAYFGMTGEIRASVAALTDALFAKFTTRRPTEADEAQVFRAICDNWYDGSEWHMRLPQARKELLMYAFENASAAGKSGDWKYIGGILEKLRQRGIRTLREAEDYDINREIDRGWTI